MHPSKKIPKTYQVKIKGVLDEEKLAKLRRPMRLEDGWTAPAEVRKLKLLKENSWIEVTIHEGRKRQIRRMLHRVGHPVIRLVRRKVDGIAMGPLKAGELRELSAEEVRRIKEAVGMREEAA
jgi:23S rRNA pseudouridine2605 synthase